jgi:ATP-binding cassette subfamily C protein EexD
MGRALAPLDLIINSWKGFNGARSSYKRIDELLEAFPKEKEYMQLPAPQGNLSLENVVVFPPLAEKPSLYGVNMQIKKGEVVGIIGPSAAGKSSLARVMLGLWPLKSGNVRIDGADIYQWDREDLGAYIGYLPQDIELFEGTVSQNIARFGEIDPAKVVEAAQIAGVHELVLSLPEGYDTVIGSGGATLSGGQRQRIAFARAIYNNPVFVVLDEPNSNLDEQGEKALVSAVNTLKARGTTVVLITHRPNILQTTDKLAVINAGVIELYGDTKDVLAKLAAKANESSASLARPAK